MKNIIKILFLFISISSSVYGQKVDSLITQTVKEKMDSLNLLFSQKDTIGISNYLLDNAPHIEFSPSEAFQIRIDTVNPVKNKKYLIKLKAWIRK